ncbi:hypothetical protein P4H71_22765 [Paenibacillus kribbensis]|uniref:hypothetical protein n=1 Tax=Paenibacillus TaxID=44249 RepID=UPI00024F0414|nr:MULTISPECIES: hypothetical protein [Paenibacillus]EHS56862.1 hypothetical protein WG8_3132 [Paenibacillus sp. Aloe-11]MEC0237149.1 hypothetical protein [Paenibacillus kribbensis]
MTIPPIGVEEYGHHSYALKLGDVANYSVGTPPVGADSTEMKRLTTDVGAKAAG